MNLEEASTQLAPYLRNDEAPEKKISLACERLLSFGKYKGLTGLLELSVYDSNRVVLPQDFETILGICNAGRSVTPRDPWFRFANGKSFCADPSMYSMDLGDGYATFRPVAGALGLRLSGETTAGADPVATGNMVVSDASVGNVNGVYIPDGSSYGKPAYLNQNDVGDVRLAWEPPNWVFRLLDIFMTPAAFVTDGSLDTTTPDLDTTWEGPASAPYPTVTAEMTTGTPTGDDAEVPVSIEVRTNADQGVRSAIQTFSGDASTLRNEFITAPIEDVVSFSKGRSTYPMILEARFPSDPATWVPVGVYQPRDEAASLRCYSVPNAEAGDTLLVLAKRRFRPLSEGTDVLPIDSIYVLRLALEALSYEDAGDLEKASQYWGIARKSLDDALSEHRNAAGRTLPIFVRAAAGKGLRAIR